MIKITKDWIDKSGIQYWITNEVNIIIGEFKLDCPTTRGDYWWIFDFKIYQQYQDQGFGTQTMKLILQLEHLKDKKILLTVNRENKRAIHLYNKFGFELVSTSFAHKTDDTYKLVNNNYGLL